MYIVDVRCHIGTLYCLICIQYVDLHITILIITMNLLPQNNKPTKISEKEELFLQNLFSNGGYVVAAAEKAGYTKGSAGWLRTKLSDEIIKRSKNLLASASVKATNRLISLIDSPQIERGDDLRLKAAESLLNRVGLGKEETHNHNVQALHGVVLLPAKKEIKNAVS